MGRREKARTRHGPVPACPSWDYLKPGDLKAPEETLNVAADAPRAVVGHPGIQDNGAHL